MLAEGPCACRELLILFCGDIWCHLASVYRVMEDSDSRVVKSQGTVL